MASPIPRPLGLKKSFGYGDRLGLATPGHLAANRKSDFAPIFAQQSIREMNRTGRTPGEVMQAAVDALDRLNFNNSWGADADHLKTEEDVAATSKAGFTFFTIDPSEFVNDEADAQPTGRIIGEVEGLYAEGVFKTLDWDERFLGEKFVVGSNVYRFDRETLYRAAIKYARALAHCEKLATSISSANGYGNYEIEISVDETASPTTPLEHLFIALELKHRGIPVVSVAPRFVGDFEKGIDYKGDLHQFESTLKEHVEIAKRHGPYKISVHSGSDKFSIYPILGRVCGDLLHVKTAGTSYLEALRTIFRVDPQLFRELLEYCGGRFAEDRRSYHISTTEDEVRSALKNAGSADEQALFEDRPVRQLLHVTFGSVLSAGKNHQGRPFREVLLETLRQHDDEHQQALEAHFDRHLRGLSQG